MVKKGLSTIKMQTHINVEQAIQQNHNALEKIKIVMQ